MINGILQAMSEVEVPLLKALDPNPDNAELTKLPFYDPHELLNWLVSTGRVDVKETDIKCRGEMRYYVS